MNYGSKQSGVKTHHPCQCTLTDPDKMVCVNGFELGYRKEVARLWKKHYSSLKGKQTLKRDGEPEDFELNKQIKINEMYPVFEGASDCIIDGFIQNKEKY